MISRSIEKTFSSKKPPTFIENYILFYAIKGYYSLEVKCKKYLHAKPQKLWGRKD